MVSALVVCKTFDAVLGKMSLVCRRVRIAGT